MPDVDGPRALQSGYIGITGATALASGPREGGMGYPSCMGYSQAELDLIARTEEVEIETSGAGGAVHRTVIWAVVDGDAVFVRSWKGANARWYREALAEQGVALHVDGRRLPARAVPATDPSSVERTSAGILRKYAGDPAAMSMVRPEVLDLTFRLERQ